MRGKTIAFIICALMVFIFISAITSEWTWTNKEQVSSPMREAVGLPSIAIGNLNPASRNPGLELFCTGLLDTPGGYCTYFINGVPLLNFTLSGNITVSEP
jgi:hypothetical protein